MTMQLSAGSLPALLGMWLVMLTAMMSPLLIGLLRHLGVQSLARRRRWAWSLFVAGYAAVWALGGLLLLGAAGLLDRIGAPGVAAVSVAALWQFTPAKQRCLNRHHARPPLAAFGRKAELAALRFGAGQGIWCIGSCWALMLLPLVLHTHQLTVMAAVTLWIWAEQFEFPSLATWRVRIPTRALLIVRAAAVRIRWQPVQQPSPKVIS
jgi:predicted metal-binding membrane protein